jgi:ABC-type dipeptide/oligopeptide/nickel transport system permease component
MAIVGYLIRRLLTGLIVVWLVATAAFFLFFARPVITVAHQLAGRAATPQVINEVIANLGLNQPIMTQYWHFLNNLIHGNLGYSYFSGESVDTMLKQDLPPTISLVIGATLLWLIVGLGVGVISATRARSLFDRVSTFGVLVGLSMPAFVIGELLIGFVFQPLYSHGFHFFNTGCRAVSCSRRSARTTSAPPGPRACRSAGWSSATPSGPPSPRWCPSSAWTWGSCSAAWSWSRRCSGSAASARSRSRRSTRTTCR